MRRSRPATRSAPWWSRSEKRGAPGSSLLGTRRHILPEREVPGSRFDRAPERRRARFLPGGRRPEPERWQRRSGPGSSPGQADISHTELRHRPACPGRPKAEPGPERRQCRPSPGSSPGQTDISHTELRHRPACPGRPKAEPGPERRQCRPGPGSSPGQTDISHAELRHRRACPGRPQAEPGPPDTVRARRRAPKPLPPSRTRAADARPGFRTAGGRSPSPTPWPSDPRPGAARGRPRYRPSRRRSPSARRTR